MKIDVTKIAGYEGMSAEEKLKALESYEYDDNSKEIERLKNSITKSNADAADWKRKYQDTLSDEQKRQAEMDDIRNRLAEAQAREQKNQYISQFMACGASREMAGQMADSFMNQKEDYFSIMQSFLAERDRAVSASLMKATPKPAGGVPATGTMTKEQILSIKDTAARQKAIAENIDLFR